ncbi:MAG: penicillin-insensitive murein endopeptidase [Gemmatimonadales bacterium]
MIRVGSDTLATVERELPSGSHGSPERGWLEHGGRLPTRGSNFVTYSYLGSLLGRTSVHSAVRAAVVDAYASLHVAQPDLTFVYGETGWPRGGRFWPHRTHQNGLSVDFMVPVRDQRGRSVRLPTPPWRKFGYGIEFDSTGRWKGLRLDFEAMALHLDYLEQTARQHGLTIEVVIFASELQPALFATTSGRTLRKRIRFSTRPAWVRHDEHDHVNFRLAAA